MECINLADLNISYLFNIPHTRDFFEGYLKEVNTCDDSLTLNDSEVNNLNIKKDHIRDLEYYYILKHLTNILLRHNRAIYHGVSLKIKNKTYILTAASGVGKTTQYLNLKSLYKDDIKLINGDKQVLNFTESDIHLYSSPWKGKEKFGIIDDAKLDGVIVLKQSKENVIRQLKPEEAIIPIILHFLYEADNTDDISIICKLTEKIIKSVPVWFFENTGTLDSSMLLYDTLIKYQGDADD